MRKVSVLSVLVAVTIGLSMSLAGAATASAAKVKHSNHWAGYIATPKSGGASGFKYVTASFTVPTLDCAATPSASVYQIAGLSGYTDSYLTAAGVDESCSGGAANYSGAYWNSGSGPNDVLSVNPGDSINASVFLTASTGEATFKIADVTTGQYYEQMMSVCCYYYAGSAEVVTQGNISNEGTADFGSINFNTIKVTDSTQSGSKPMNNSAWTLVEFAEYGPVTGLVDVQPGPLSSTSKQSAFTNTWERQKTPRK